MKLSNLCPVVALLIVKAIAHPAPVPASTRVPVSQDPSPPRPFPKYALEGTDPLSRFPSDPKHEAAGPFVVTKDPPKYPLVKGNVLEERVPLALSRFPADGEDEANDPSPPRPFPAGRISATEGSSPPPEQQKPKRPHTIEVDYIFEAGNPLEKRGPLSRFPTDDEEEANDPSPPRPFPPGRISEANDSSPSHIIEPRIPSPRLRTSKGSEAKANDPPPSDLKPRAEDVGLPPDHAHGGYFPPSNPPVSEPTASATDVESLSAGLDKRRCPSQVECVVDPVPPFDTPDFMTIYLPPSTTSNPNTTASETQAADPPGIRYLQPPRLPLVTLPKPEFDPARRPHHRIPVATAFAPHPTSTSTSNATFTSLSNYNTTSLSNYTATIFSNRSTTTFSGSATVSNTSATPSPCTATITRHMRSVDPTKTITIHSTTVTKTYPVNCRGCSAVTIMTVDFDNSGPHASTPSLSATETVTVTHPGAATENVHECWIYPTHTHTY